MADKNRSIWKLNDGLYLGFGCTQRNRGRPEMDVPVMLETDRHGLIFGPNGSGKSRRALVPILLNNVAWSMVVLDPKGELYQMTAPLRRAAGNKVLAIDPFKVTGTKERHGHNTVAALDPKSPTFVDDCMGQAQVLCPVDSKEPYWELSAQELIGGGIMHARHVHGAEASLDHVRDFLTLRAPTMETVARQMRQDSVRFDLPELATKISRFADITPDNKELAGIVSAAVTKTAWLDSPSIKADLSGGFVDWSSLRRQPTTVYIVLPANRIAQYAAWLKLILHSAMSGLLQDPAPAAVPTLFMLDEASLVSGIPMIERNMAIMRGFGLKLLSVYQDEPQARLALGERFESYVANAGFMIGFGCQDPRTAKTLADRAGMTTIDQMSLSMKESADRDRDEANFSFSKGKGPVVTPQTLMNLPDGFAVVYTHQHRQGPFFSYFPDPSEMPETAELIKRTA